MTIYTRRPPASRKSARIAWDCLVNERLPTTIVRFWFARFGLHDCAWVAEYSDGEYSEIDSLCIQDRINNPHKYQNTENLQKATS